jgi:hypothetical protein
MNAKNLSRRAILKGGAAAAVGASLLTFNQAFGYSKLFGVAAADDDAATVANLAATAELFASTHYMAAISNAKALGLDNESVLKYLKAGFLAEEDHYDLLTGALKAKPVVTEFYVPANLFSDKKTFLATTEVAETTFVSAYLAATRIFAMMGKDGVSLAVTAAQIAAVEAEHRLFIRQQAGLLPNNQSYAEFQFENVSGAVPVLMPFIDPAAAKKAGFVGPVKPPTADEVKALRAEAKAIGYDGKGAPYAAMKM